MAGVKFKGTDVLGLITRKSATSADILFARNGQIEAYVVSVGSLLGMGSKEVAVAPSSFDVVPGSNGGGDKLKLSMTKDQPKQAKISSRIDRRVRARPVPRRTAAR